MASFSKSTPVWLSTSALNHCRIDACDSAPRVTTSGGETASTVAPKAVAPKAVAGEAATGGGGGAAAAAAAAPPPLPLPPPLPPAALLLNTFAAVLTALAAATVEPRSRSNKSAGLAAAPADPAAPVACLLPKLPPSATSLPLASFAWLAAALLSFTHAFPSAVAVWVACTRCSSADLRSWFHAGISLSTSSIISPPCVVRALYSQARCCKSNEAWFLNLANTGCTCGRHSSYKFPIFTKLESSRPWVPWVQLGKCKSSAFTCSEPDRPGLSATRNPNSPNTYAPTFTKVSCARDDCSPTNSFSAANSCRSLWLVTMMIRRCQMSSETWSPAKVMSFKIVVTYHSRSTAYFSATMAIFSTISSRMVSGASAKYCTNSSTMLTLLSRSHMTNKRSKERRRTEMSASRRFPSTVASCFLMASLPSSCASRAMVCRPK
mmetsp:Transcript_15511/g.28618  ORF Transcript_15511/g.28618 Transcript_15511/m.28618 type:complete len:435 (-) Transcript_15511:1145-2449(-)